MRHDNRARREGIPRLSFTPVYLGLLLFSLMTAASPGHAIAERDGGLFQQVEIGPISVGIRGTYYDPKDASGKWYGGAQARLHFLRFFAIEGSADYRKNDFGDTRAETVPVQGSLLLYPFGTTRVAPFILGGAGWYYTRVKGPGGFEDTQDRFGVHAGGGVQVFFTPHFSIDGTYRYVWLEKVESRDQSLSNKSFNDNGHMVTIALNFHF